MDLDTAVSIYLGIDTWLYPLLVFRSDMGQQQINYLILKQEKSDGGR